MTTVKAGQVYSIMNHRRENGLLTGSKCPLLLSASNTVSNTAALGWKGTRDKRIDPGSLIGQKGRTWSRGPLSLSLSFVLCLYENTLSPALLPWWLLFIFIFFEELQREICAAQTAFTREMQHMSCRIKGC